MLIQIYHIETGVEITITSVRVNQICDDMFQLKCPNTIHWYVGLSLKLIFDVLQWSRVLAAVDMNLKLLYDL